MLVLKLSVLKISVLNMFGTTYFATEDFGTKDLGTKDFGTKDFGTSKNGTKDVCLVLWLFCYWFGPLLAARVFDWLVVVSVCVCLLVFVSVSYCMSVWLPPQAGPHTQGHLHIGLGRCRIPGGGDGFPCRLGRFTGSQLMRSIMRATTQKL